MRGLVHVEAIVGQKPGGFELDPVAETRTVVAQAPQLGGRKLTIVPFVHLGREDAESVRYGEPVAAVTQVTQGVTFLQRLLDATVTEYQACR